MTDRERWTVYPLLFLSLGIAMRNKMTSSLELPNIGCETMRCNRLLVQAPDGSVQVAAATTPQGGILETLSPNGTKQVVLRPSPQGGTVETWLATEKGPVIIRFPETLFARVPTGGDKPQPLPDGKTPIPAPPEKEQPKDTPQPEKPNEQPSQP